MQRATPNFHRCIYDVMLKFSIRNGVIDPCNMSLIEEVLIPKDGVLTSSNEPYAINRPPPAIIYIYTVEKS